MLPKTLKRRPGLSLTLALSYSCFLLLCLFLSMKSGVGSKLLHNVEAIAQKNGVKKLYLWADATCDYEYYRKRGYSEAAHFTNNILPQLGVQETWIYSKELKE